MSRVGRCVLPRHDPPRSAGTSLSDALLGTGLGRSCLREPWGGHGKGSRALRCPDGGGGGRQHVSFKSRTGTCKRRTQAWGSACV